ncbi:putative intracellular protease/amidase [Inquilinus ginsengisoli]|uniref:hypothetical protein n=1 Tax=Inquilinus ginsengisoli TaxID=363840 RepID=UPI003D1BF228
MTAPMVLDGAMHSPPSWLMPRRSGSPHVVPFLVEDELKRLGGLFEKAPNWQSFVVRDGRLITGQNPASSTAGAQALLKLLSDTQRSSPASSAA